MNEILTAGANAITVTACDKAGNSTTTQISLILDTTSTSRFVYDANGNMTQRTELGKTTLYTYDYENRLTSLSSPQSFSGDLGTTVTYTYDPLGRRIRKSQDTSHTSQVANYIYDGNNIIQERTGSSTINYLYGPRIDDILVMYKSGTPYYYHKDALGSITNLTSSTGSVIESYIYDAYGNLLTPASSIGNRYYFTGREFDQETGLYYYRNRYYDPMMGRFISQDPFGIIDGSNLYAYTNNNPVNFIDPYGLMTVVIHGAGEHPSGYSGAIGKRLRSQGETVIETHWSGNILSSNIYSDATSIILSASRMAEARGEKLNIITHSWGSVAGGEILNATGIKVDNFITMGSPYSDFSGISSNWTNFWSPADPISWGSALSGIFNPNQRDIYSGIPHLNYWNNSSVVDKISNLVGKNKCK